MIDADQGLEFRVKLWANKETLGEYKLSPQSPLYMGDPRHRMINAKTDQQFQVEVVITKDFNFKGARYVRALVEFDGGTRSVTEHVYNNSIRNRGDRKHAYTKHISAF